MRKGKIYIPIQGVCPESEEEQAITVIYADASTLSAGNIWQKHSYSCPLEADFHCEDCPIYQQAPSHRRE